jgi:hypothetical protein
MLFQEISVVYSENHIEHITTLYGQNAVFMLKQLVHIVTTLL